ncbi:MAG: 50S ribosomal protein L13 [Candidatus Phytoplasma australasiaticum]|nr:50S ribosomal protein L13 [Candidatus Phytoplasma australasiaticum]
MTNNTTVFYNKNLTDLNRTSSMSENDLKRKWYIIDANQKVLGRIATKISSILMGKHKTVYTPHIDNGDYVIVINAKKVNLTSRHKPSRTVGGGRFPAAAVAVDRVLLPWRL